MIMGVDNINLEDCNEPVVELGHIKDVEEKYVYAVDHRVDIIVTSNKKVAQYFRDNNIAAFVQV